jgi:general secretion pathway protein M
LIMGSLKRTQIIAVAALGLLIVTCGLSVALTLAMRLDAGQELADRQDVLARLEARAQSRPQARGVGGFATAPAQAFLDAATSGLASAELQAHVARLADQHAVLVSFGTQPAAGDEADVVRAEASLDITLGDLQVLLYQLESGTPYVFVDSMTVRSATTTAGGAESARLRVTLGLRALWRRRAA